MQNKPVCYDPSFHRPEVFSGVPSFIGLPVVRDKKLLKNYDFAVMGVPWEGICTYGGITGVESATKTIRIASERYGGYLPEYDFDIFDHFSGCDYGDAAVKNGDREFTFNSVHCYIKDILDAGAMPITFGGDHSLSYPLILAFAEHYNGKIGIIHFDAHMDNMDFYGEERFARCSPFHRLYDYIGFNPANLVSVGIRGPRNHYSALSEAKKYGASVITAFEIKEIGIKTAVQKAIDIASRGTDALYVTVCSDVLDASCNIGGPNDHCGLTTYELAYMLHECGLAGCSGFDYMEVYPPSDIHNFSSHGACWMALFTMSGMAQHMLTHRQNKK